MLIFKIVGPAERFARQSFNSYVRSEVVCCIIDNIMEIAVNWIRRPLLFYCGLLKIIDELLNKHELLFTSCVISKLFSDQCSRFVQKYRYDRVNGIQKEKKRVLRFRWSDRVDFVSIIVNTGMKRAVRFHIYPTTDFNINIRSSICVISCSVTSDTWLERTADGHRQYQGRTIAARSSKQPLLEGEIFGDT